MLNNLTNIFNLIKSRMVKTVLETDDLFVVGTKDGKYDGNYKPTAVPVSVVAAGIVPYLPPASTGLFTQTANGPIVTATITESTIIGAGVGSLTIPANAFQVGDSFRVDIMGHISAKNNDTIRIRVKAGSILLGDTGVVTMPNITSKHFDMSLNFTIRSLGAAGVASIASGGQFTYSKNASNAFEGSDFSLVNNTTFDTTISNTLNITVEWSSTSALNSIYTEILTLYKTY